MSHKTASPLAAPASPLVRRFARNLHGRDLIVGDVHGCFSKLADALFEVGFDPAAGDRLFSVGDLVDRGPESADVLWWLAQPWFAAVQGNHEDMAVRFGQPGCAMDVQLYAKNGGAWNIGHTPPERVVFADALGALPLAIELATATGTVGVVHADCPLPTWFEFVAALEDPALSNARLRALREAALWSRDRVEARRRDGVPDLLALVVGHTPLDAVLALGNVLHIDTAGWLQGGASPRRFTILDAATLAPPAARPPVRHLRRNPS
jgi:serine/threonine protein phosphatase 1